MKCKNCIFQNKNIIKNICKITGEEIKYLSYNHCTASIEELDKIIGIINNEKMRRNLIKSCQAKKGK